jgi:hypothetical protein
MTYEDVGAVPDVVAGTLQLDTMQVYALIDLGASHSFISYRIVNNLHVLFSNLGVGVIIRLVHLWGRIYILMIFIEG